MDAEDVGLFANLQQLLVPEVTRGEITNAYCASDAVIQKLGFRPHQLQGLGLNLRRFHAETEGKKGSGRKRTSIPIKVIMADERCTAAMLCFLERTKAGAWPEGPKM
ncbi:hypothetical protein FN846DRAFT_916919 [Sphaerosporella brunnea]|uniref:Uncharacterized protein n=1 Tax=Sphaerosporella brunnea TaxID=1250544 RepID=A0A5J5F4Z6_9PEZI|nr:hypothetical protein FN846DRAFT_916919 [Sphaerosporella brunnea]